MKRILFSIISLAMLFCVASCDKNELDPLSGIYPEAQKMQGLKMTDAGVTEQDGYNVFNIDADNLHLQFTSKNWYLAEGTYNVDSAPGSNVLLTSSTIEGKALDHGSLNVFKDDDDYTISGTLWLSESSPVMIKGTGTFVYVQKILEPKYYYSLDSSTSDGLTKYVLSLTDLQGNHAANFTVYNSGAIAGSYTFSTELTGLKSGEALMGYDLSILGLGVGGCYFEKDGTRWFMRTGNVTVSGDESMYSVDVTGMTAVDASNNTYQYDTISFSNAIKPDPKDITYEGWSCSYKATDNTTDGTTEHVLSLKDSKGADAGQIVVTTNMLEGIAGSFQPSDDKNKIGRYTPGADYSAFGIGIIGSYYIADGVKNFITGGTINISSSEGTVSVTVSDIKCSTLNNVGSVSFPSMKVVSSGDDKGDDDKQSTYSIEGGTYTLSSAPKEGMDGVTENTFLFKDSEGAIVAQYVEWTATDGSIEGNFTYAATTATAIGSFAGGMDFLGMYTFGSYYVKDGVEYLINAGNAEVSKSADGLSLKIKDMSSAAKDGTAGTDGVLSLSTFKQAE